ncbi:LysE family transporter [Streptomyces syringium]|uniref:Threonine/homoserine/homoserine lactone efflux protein n=1 Tax=Streptomyces syringium TaxID=76729 RepID=A0ABS4YAK0_9ACTN|nr:LysE family transporter [Streptomyces syringium]MBP2405754.1 threonine/homoserine/homoserine lactone efflux protein [Streptomyces syringium]
MITLEAIGTFALIVGLLTLTPGLDTALILRTTALGHRRRVLLAGVHILLAVIWACALIAFAHVLRDRLRRPSARRYLDRITGTVIAAFGIRLALGQ